MAEPDDTARAAEPVDRGPGYRLSARGRQEAEDDRLDLLEHIFDPLSRRRRDLVQPGWRCLEVGAGRGSMAVWLAQRVGESGHVVATDIDLTYLKPARCARPLIDPDLLTPDDFRHQDAADREDRWQSTKLAQFQSEARATKLASAVCFV